MKIKYLGLIFTAIYLVLMSCSDMNDKHDFYLQDGEILYIGRVDSAIILPGNERFILRYWITDLRAKELKIFWNEKRDSLITSIPKHQATEAIDFMVGDSVHPVPEGSYTFQLVSSDGEGLTSVTYDKLGDIYGPLFGATLVDRFVKQTIYDQDSNRLTITWGAPSSTKDIGIELTYYKGEEKKVIKIMNEDGTQTILDNYNIAKGGSYRTIFLPDENAIDTFYSATSPVVIIQNVALNKPTVTSSVLNASFPGANAVDGIISTASRWISSSTEGVEHWIEIDLGKEYTIVSLSVFKQAYNQYLLPNFNVQVNDNGDWKNVLEVKNYLSDDFESTFKEEIRTDKVRIFVPNYQNNMARIKEIEVYARL